MRSRRAIMCVEQRAQRREADAAGDDHHVAPFGHLDRPAAAERPAQASGVAALEVDQIFGGRGTGGTDRQLQAVRPETRYGDGRRGNRRQGGHDELTGAPGQ